MYAQNTALTVLMLDEFEKEIPEIAPLLGLDKDWQKTYKLGFLIPMSGTEPDLSLLKGMLKIRRDDEKDYKKLLASIKMQLQHNGLMLNSNHISQGEPQKNIFEFKAPHGGHSRLFAFISGGNIFICTHVWRKTKDSKKQQNKEFQKAERMRLLYQEVNSEA